MNSGQGEKGVGYGDHYSKQPRDEYLDRVGAKRDTVSVADDDDTPVQDFGHPQLLPTRAGLGLPERNPHTGAFVFACFNKHVKIRRELFEMWCLVLAKVINTS